MKGGAGIQMDVFPPGVGCLELLENGAGPSAPVMPPSPEWSSDEEERRRQEGAVCGVESVVDCMLEIKTYKEVQASGEGLAPLPHTVRGDTCKHTPEQGDQRSLQQGVSGATSQQ